MLQSAPGLQVAGIFRELRRRDPELDSCVAVHSNVVSESGTPRLAYSGFEHAEIVEDDERALQR